MFRWFLGLFRRKRKPYHVQAVLGKHDKWLIELHHRILDLERERDKETRCASMVIKHVQETAEKHGW